MIINNAKYDTEGSTGALWDDLVQASIMKQEVVTQLLSEWFINDRIWAVTKMGGSSSSSSSSGSYNNTNTNRYNNNSNNNNMPVSAMLGSKGMIVHKQSVTPNKQVCILALIKRAIPTAPACPHRQCKFRHDIKRSEMAEVLKAMNLIKDQNTQQKVKQHMVEYPAVYPDK